MLRLRCYVLLSVAVAGLALSIGARAAAYVSPLVGGGGGDNYTRSCGTGGILVGLQGKFGSWIDQLTPICVQVAANGTLGSTFTLSRIGGTGGLNIEEFVCPSGKILAGLVVRWASFINTVELRCASWDTANKSRGATLSGAGTVGSSGGVTTTSLTCPGSQVAKALKGKAGIYVDSLSLVCNAWNQ